MTMTQEEYAALFEMQKKDPTIAGMMKGDKSKHFTTRKCEGIQAYVNIYDLQPIEAWFDVDDKPIEGESGIQWTFDMLYDDIKKNGLRYALKVDRYGNLLNGNCRYWIVRKLFEEGDERFRYIPIEQERISGSQIMEFKTSDGQPPTRRDIAENFTAEAAVKVEVAKSKTEFEEYEVSDNGIALTRALNRGRVQWQIFGFKVDDQFYAVGVCDDRPNK